MGRTSQARVWEVDRVGGVGVPIANRKPKPQTYIYANRIIIDIQ